MAYIAPLDDLPIYDSSSVTSLYGTKWIFAREIDDFSDFGSSPVPFSCYIEIVRNDTGGVRTGASGNGYGFKSTSDKYLLSCNSSGSTTSHNVYTRDGTSLTDYSSSSYTGYPKGSTSVNRFIISFISRDAVYQDWQIAFIKKYFDLISLPPPTDDFSNQTWRITTGQHTYSESYTSFSAPITEVKYGNYSVTNGSSFVLQTSKTYGFFPTQGLTKIYPSFALASVDGQGQCQYRPDDTGENIVDIPYFDITFGDSAILSLDAALWFHANAVNITPTPKITLDLSTIGLTPGVHRIGMKLSDNGVTKRDSDMSNIVEYTVLPQLAPTQDTAFQLDSDSVIEWSEIENASSYYIMVYENGAYVKKGEVTPPAAYSITPTLIRVVPDSNNPTSINPGETVLLKFTAEEGYSLPKTITVQGADATWSLFGADNRADLYLRNATDNVSFIIEATHTAEIVDGLVDGVTLDAEGMKQYITRIPDTIEEAWATFNGELHDADSFYVRIYLGLNPGDVVTLVYPGEFIVHCDVGPDGTIVIDFTEDAIITLIKK